MWSCAAAAIAVTAGNTAQQARAQAFAGTPTLPNPNIAVDGAATRTITSGTTETITVSTNKATINWIPTDNDGSGTIDFLPAGNVATFTNDPLATADFTVLNRIVPLDQSRPIALNGSVISTLQSVSGTATGGHVWFYSPGGIIVGATAVFNVGGLLLTANDPISYSPTANGFTGQFTAAANSTASVTIDPGAKISATPENSYVALVAPRVVQGGEVNVNGSAAYVAGEDVTLTMNQGLFDIQVDVGTSDPFSTDGPNGIVHTGTTGGPASTGAGDNHKIYMVAVPKNQALTMLLSGTAGFTPAGAAQVVNGEIVLSAGWSIFDTGGSRSISSPIFSDASIQIDPGMYTSNVFAIARGDITAIANNGDMTFLGSVNFNTYDAANTGNVTLGAEADNTLTVGGSALLNSSNPANFSEVKIYADDFGRVGITGAVTMAAQAGPGDGGTATISADNDGEISIGGLTTVIVDGTYFSPADAGLEQFAQSAFGGSINVTAFNNGLITTGAMNLSANGTGQDSIGGDAGSGYGGYIQISADSGGDIEMGGTLFANAKGFGGNIFTGTFITNTSGGFGSGGSIYMSVGDGTIGVTGDVNLDSSALGGTIGDSGSGATQFGGSGWGGSAFLYSNGPGTITVSGATNLLVRGTGGNGQTGGSGFGGRAGIYAYDGTIDLGPTIGIFAAGIGGNASFGLGGNGGFGGGGTAYIEALANTGAVPTAGTITADAGGYGLIDATGNGGSGGAGNGDNIAAGAGGDGAGGVDCGECSGGAFALAQVDGALLSLGNVDVRAQGFGGAGGTGGAGQPGGIGGRGFGGFTQAGLIDNEFNPTGATTGSASFGNLTLVSSGFGGAGGASLFEQGDGGAAFGGDAWFQSFTGTVNATSADIRANGTGGTGSTGGAGQGGTAEVTIDGGSISVVDFLVVFASGIGGAGATGGDGYGGTITGQITSNGGSLTVGNLMRMEAEGQGGDGVDNPAGAGGDAGDGYGGTSEFTVSDALAPDASASLDLGDTYIRANGLGGFGGNGVTGGGGGDGFGGTASYYLGSGIASAGELLVSTTPIAGDGGNGSDGAGGAGGDAFGGLTTITIRGDQTATLVYSLSRALAGNGGSGTVDGDGGYAEGADASIDVLAGATLDANIYIGVNAVGGNGGTGGDALGGNGSLSVEGTLTSGDIFVEGTGIGGAGSSGAGGAGHGANVNITANGGTIDVAGALSANADGTGGSANVAGAGGTGFGGATLLTVNGGRISFTDGVLSTRAFGGLGYTGGDAFGGVITASITDLGGRLEMNGDVLLTANAFAGFGVDAPGGTGGTGGTGYGGDVTISIPSSLAPLATAALQFGNLDLRANGNGGFGGAGTDGGDAGAGYGGTTSFTTGAATVTGGTLIISARGIGGDGGAGSTGTGGFGGYGEGGFNDFLIDAAGSIDATTLTAYANGIGGVGGAGGTAQGGGGDGVAGSNDFTIDGTGTFDGSVANFDGFVVTAFGFGGDGDTGGQATGGTTTITVNGALTVAGQIQATGGAQGGNGNHGGDANGGTATLTVNGNLTAGRAFVANFAIGGNGTLSGGDATGGHATLELPSGTGVATITNSATVSANATGGNSSAGTGGSAQAGDAHVKAHDGTHLSINNLALSADAFGGSGVDGGDAQGGFVEAIAVQQDALLTLTGLAVISATGTGGNGTIAGTGGDGLGGTAGLYAGIDDNPDSPLVGGTITAVNANVTSYGRGGSGGLGGNAQGGLGQVGTRYGSLTVTGALFGDAGAGGGNSLAGVGGTGTGGTFQVAANFFGDTGLSTTNLGSADLWAVGVGGNGGGSGSAGGDGFGGLVQVSSPTAGSTITATALSLHAGANGGVGGSGAVGGRGGDANGGHALIDISAGTANLGVVSSFARGVAGNGGVGSSGAGGDGGDGFAGLVELNVAGSLSGTSYLGDAQANGGNGGAGTTTQGAGGLGEGGTAYLNAYFGSMLDFTGAVVLDASGQGGTGSSLGDAFGGFAQFFASGSTIDAGDITLAATGNFGGIAELSLFASELTANSLTLNVNGVASAGTATLGVGTDPFEGIGSILTLNAFTANANGGDNGDIFVSVDDGSSADLGVANLSALGPGGGGEIHEIDITIGGTPLLLFGGIGTLGLNNTVLTADSLNLTTSGTIDITSFNGASIDVAGLFHADAGGAMTLDDVDGTAVARADVIDFHANSFSSTFDILGRVIGIFSVQNLDVTNTVLIADEILTLQSDADVIAGDLDAGLEINLFAGGDITAGDLDSGGSIFAEAQGDLTLGDLTAVGEVHLESGGNQVSSGNMVFGDADVGSLDFEADGTVTGGNILAVNHVGGDAGGAVNLGNITVTGPELAGDFSVGIASGTSIDVGNVSGTDRVGFATLGDLTTGNITAGSLFMTLVGGDVTVGSVTTAPSGRVYMADVSMFLANGGPDNFNPAPVLAASPVPTGGSITITGPVSTGRFQAAAGVDFTSGAIAATGDVEIVAINDLTTANITAGGLVDLLSDGTGGLGNIQFGDVTADVLKFSADGTVTGGNVVAVTKVTGDAQGAIALGNITVTGPEAGGDFSVGIGSETSVAVGNVSAVGRVGLVTFGDLTTGNITAGPLFMALASGDVTVGSVTTAPSGQVYVADSSMFVAAGGTDNFDASLVLPLAPVPTGGSITFGGPVSTGRFQAAAGIDLHTANVTAGTSVEASAGHDILTGNIAFGQFVTLSAGNDIVAGDLDGGHNVTFNAGNNLSVGDVDADGTATFTAVGLASFLGTVGVPTITVTSSDINVPFGGLLGVWGVTNLLTLNAVSSNPIIIGQAGALAAAAAVPQYVLHEDGDIQANTLVINAVGANGGPDPDIIVHNVSIDGSLAPEPAVSHVVVNTDASVLVDGQVLFTGAGATDSLAINAGDSIQVNTTAGGRIAMVNNAEDRPAGLLTLSSDHIWVGSQSLLDQLNTNVNFAGRDALVGTNPGTVNPEGFLIADGMTLSIGDSLFVQNSGSGADYAGITVGAGGLKVVTTGTAPAEVVAYGRKMNPDGTFVMGNTFFGQVDFTKGTSHYTSLAEFNECLINTGCSGGGGSVGGGTLGPESILGPVDLMGNPEETIELASGEDLGDSALDGEDGGSGSSDFSTQLFSTAGLSDDALVDEGVTSGGDNNQWESQVCKPDSADQPCPTPPADKQEQ